MSIEALKDRIGSFAKDVRLNLSSMLSDETLGEQTKYGLFLAAALAARNADLVAAFEAEAASPACEAAPATR
jgi:alkyl hydroperoxide reductase subunit D